MNVDELSWKKQDYGFVAHGEIEADDRAIDATFRRPSLQAEDSGFCIVMENGWTAGKYSMRVPAIEAAYAGHVAVTFEYTNTGSESALQQNVRDVVEVTKALGDEHRIGLMGLSMGGAVATLAMESLLREADANGAAPRVEIANLVAPGKYILPKFLTKYNVTKSFVNESTELPSVMIEAPGQAMRLGVASLLNCAVRRKAVRAEIRELLDGTVHSSLRFVKRHPLAPYVRLALPVDDKLLPYDAQKPSIRGLGFDEVIDIPHGHMGLAYKPEISRELFARDKIVIPTLQELYAVDKTPIAA